MWNTNKVVNTSGLVSETRPSCWAQEIKEVMLNSSSHEEKRDQGGGRVGAGGRGELPWGCLGLGSPRAAPPRRGAEGPSLAEAAAVQKTSGRRTGDRRAKPNSAASHWANSGLPPEGRVQNETGRC